MDATTFARSAFWDVELAVLNAKPSVSELELPFWDVHHHLLKHPLQLLRLVLHPPFPLAFLSPNWPCEKMATWCALRTILVVEDSLVPKRSPSNFDTIIESTLPATLGRLLLWTKI